MVTTNERATLGLERGRTVTGIMLPNIRMRPREMHAIGRVLSACDGDTHYLFVFLMEQWERAGHVVGTTPQSIVLDARCGGTKNRIAVLLAGNLADPTSEPPVIVLSWGALRMQKEFPTAAVAEYQSAVRRFVRVRETESSAHIRLDGTFGTPHARRLLGAMRKLAKSIRQELAEKPPPIRPITPDNVRGTLAQCPPAVQTVFKKVIIGWLAVGGTAQARDVGRIYLKLKTKAHRSGRCARLPRNFSLLALAAPKRKQPAHIQAEWNLAHGEYAAYLDCIPAAVSRYERTVAALPGFVRKGTLSRVFLDDRFTRRHADALIVSIVSLKAAEEAAP